MFGNTNMLILKVTRDCNLRCSYCYVKNKDNFKGEMMEFDTFKIIIQRIISDRKKNKYNGTFTLIFHGGEPLLLGVQKFMKFLSYSSRAFKANNIVYNFGIQTNLTLINKELLTILHDFDVSVGVSFDGIRESNSARTEINTDKFEKYFLMLEEFNIKYGFLIVVNQANIKNIEESIDYVLNKYNISGIKVNYAEDVNNVGNSEVSGEDFVNKAWIPILNNFINGKYQTIVEDNIETIVKRHFAKIISGNLIIEEHKSNCGLKLCGGGMHIIEINPNGDVHFCGRYSQDFEETFVQNVKDDEFLELKQIKRFFSTIKIKDKLVHDLGCDLCPADNICDHGCIAFHYSKYGEFGIRDNLVCNIFKPLHTFLIKNEIKLFERMYETNKNNDGIWYFNAKTNIINMAKSKFINDLKNRGFEISIDPNFKSSLGINFNQSLMIKRRT